jgi:hypothetical protein
MSSAYLGVNPQIAKQIIADELAMYTQTRYRLTLRLTILNRVEADAETRLGLEKELEKIERIIAEYEKELALPVE